MVHVQLNPVKEAYSTRCIFQILQNCRLMINFGV